jgi:hypothetical protein
MCLQLAEGGGNDRGSSEDGGKGSNGDKTTIYPHMLKTAGEQWKGGEKKKLYMDTSDP